MQKDRDTADTYRKMAYEGDPRAMNNLGVCYMRGLGVVENHVTAFEWYMKAAELDDIYGIFNVAECYYKGDGVERNEALAFEWYLKAASRGDLQSQVNVANAYYLGQGIEADTRKPISGIGRLLFKVISCRRKTWVLPIGMAMA